MPQAAETLRWGAKTWAWSEPSREWGSWLEPTADEAASAAVEALGADELQWVWLTLRGWLQKVLGQFISRLGQCRWDNDTRWGEEKLPLHQRLLAAAAAVLVAAQRRDCAWANSAWPVGSPPRVCPPFLRDSSLSRGRAHPSVAARPRDS